MPRKDRDTETTPTMDAALEKLRDGDKIEATWHGLYINNRPAGTLGTPRITQATMDSLSRRGLVRKLGDDTYDLTYAGRKAVGE